MKRFMLVFVTLVLLCTVSCSHSRTGVNVLICDFSDEVSEIAPKSEYSEWSKGRYKDPRQPETVSVSVNGVEYSGTYIESEVFPGTCEVRNTYKSSDNNFFSINNDGVLTTYFWGNGEASDEVKSREECRKIALDFIYGVFGSSTDGHEERITYDKGQKGISLNIQKR